MGWLSSTSSVDVSESFGVERSKRPEEAEETWLLAVLMIALVTPATVLLLSLE